MSDYWKPLSVEISSSFEEIKVAYFRKAKEAFDLADKDQGLSNFNQIHIALAFVIGKVTGLCFSHKKADYIDLKISEIGDWENKFKNRVNETSEDAVAFYELGWSNFKKTEFYRDTHALEPAPSANFVPFIVLNFLVPTAIALLLGWTGLFFVLPIVYLTLPQWKRVFRYMFFMPMSMTLQAMAYLLNQNVFWSFAFAITNLFLFLFSTSYAFVPFDTLMKIFGGAVVLGFVIGLLKIKLIKPYTGSVLGLGLFPFLIHTFFALNLYFSTPLVVETHKLELYLTPTYRGIAMEISPLVDLEDYHYDDFMHIRHFPFREIIADKNFIRMNIHQGLFGIPVLKSWTLE